MPQFDWVQSDWFWHFLLNLGELVRVRGAGETGWA